LPVFLDANTFYNEKAGGIRTYHNSKIEWFKAHPEHQYFILGPGLHPEEITLADNVTLIRVKGFQLTSDPSGYRLLLNFFQFCRVVRRIKPDILECGDPWSTGIFGLLMKKLGLFRGLCSSFYHSNPIQTYFEPWSKKGKGQIVKRWLTAGIAKIFFGIQRRYDCTITSSQAMHGYLHEMRVDNCIYNPFGAHHLFFENRVVRRRFPGKPLRLLFAGRLSADKGTDFFKRILPEILKRELIEVTVIGRGAEEKFFQNYSHPNFYFNEFVGGQKEYLKILSEHHYFMAMSPWETFGLGALEAMASGMGVLGVDEGGVGELLQRVNHALIFKYNDQQSFFSALDLAENRDLQETAQAHSRIADEYGDWGKSISNLTEIYEQLVSHGINSLQNRDLFRTKGIGQ